MFEVILTFGNYMNSGKRGPVYGFKIQSLDLVSQVFMSWSTYTYVEYLHAYAYGAVMLPILCYVATEYSQH